MQDLEKIQEYIFICLNNLAEELENDELKNPTKETRIYGMEGNLDSLALVSFIADLEEIISKKFDLNIILADEKAMSAKNSPFKDVSTLSLYIKNLIEQKNA